MDSDQNSPIRTLLDAIDIQFAVLLDSDLRIIECSAATARLLGVSPQKLKGSVIWDLPEATLPQGSRAIISKAVAEKKFIRHEGKHGGRWHEICCRPLETTRTNNLVALYCRDITAANGTSQPQKESDASLCEIAASLPGGIFQLQRSSEGILSLPFVSEIHFGKHGIPRDGLTDNPNFLADILHPDDLNEALDHLNRSAAALSTLDCQFRVRVPSGNRLWLQATATPRKQTDGSIIWSGLILDITERRLAEDAQNSSEKRLSLAMLASNDGIWDLNLQTGETHFSPSYYTMLGYAPDELPQSHQTWLDLMHPDDRAFAVNKRRLYLDGIHDHYEAEFRMRTKDGQWRWILSRGKLVERDCNNNPLRLVGTHIDITERKDIEKKNKLYEERLLQGQKLEAIGTLAGGIAHDFNNILSAIIGYSELLEDELLANSMQYSHLQEILKAGNRARDLIRQILAFSRQAEIERRPVQVHLIIREVLKLLRSSIPSNINIVRRIDTKSGLVMADPTQIHQIIMNLCTNAYHAMDDQSGTIEVELGAVVLGPDFTDNHPQITPGSYIKLKVRDTGKGIDPKNMDRIFDPFFTTKPVGKGTGLGLATVHGIVSVLNGAITVESVLGKGSTFTVYLPQLSTGTSSIELVKPASPMGDGEHILLVDDEDAIVRLEKQMLERLGYKVSCHTGSPEALQTFKANPKFFDLIITDHTMPGMTGIQLAEEVFRIRPDIPMILCTGYSEIISAERAREIGIREYIMKPVVKNEIAGIIRKVLDKDAC